MASDSFFTLAAAAESLFKEKSSKFITYGYPVESEEQIALHLAELRKRHYDATHHCYAWRLGAKGEKFRANDDGEPSSTAGKPILGQLLSREVTNCLVVVVRYFGGTKLGVSGLIEAYRDSTALLLDEAEIVEQMVEVAVEVRFVYEVMNGVMKVVKEMQPRIVRQDFDNMCTMVLSIRESQSEMMIAKLDKVEGATLEKLEVNS